MKREKARCDKVPVRKINEGSEQNAPTNNSLCNVEALQASSHLMRSRSNIGYHKRGNHKTKRRADVLPDQACCQSAKSIPKKYSARLGNLSSECIFKIPKTQVGRLGAKPRAVAVALSCGSNQVTEITAAPELRKGEEIPLKTILRKSVESCDATNSIHEGTW